MHLINGNDQCYHNHGSDLATTQYGFIYPHNPSPVKWQRHSGKRDDREKNKPNIKPKFAKAVE